MAKSKKPSIPSKWKGAAISALGSVPIKGVIKKGAQALKKASKAVNKKKVSKPTKPKVVASLKTQKKTVKKKIGKIVKKRGKVFTKARKLPNNLTKKEQISNQKKLMNKQVLAAKPSNPPMWCPKPNKYTEAQSIIRDSRYYDRIDKPPVTIKDNKDLTMKEVLDALDSPYVSESDKAKIMLYHFSLPSLGATAVHGVKTGIKGAKETFDVVNSKIKKAFNTKRMGNTVNLPNTTFTTKKLQHEFKHAEDFGVTGNWSKAKGEAYQKAIQNHIDTATDVYKSTYRGQDVHVYINKNTGVGAYTDLSGNYIGGWKFSTDQMKFHLTNGTKIK